MHKHVMTSESALSVIAELDARDVPACVGGGWAVEIGMQTREPSDVDLWLPAAALVPLIAAFSRIGIDRVLPWGGDRPSNFVLHDGAHLRVDLHLYEELADGVVHCGWRRDATPDTRPAPWTSLTSRNCVPESDSPCPSSFVPARRPAVSRPRRAPTRSRNR